MKRKKIVSLLTAVMLTAVTLSGCGETYEKGSKNYNITLITMDQMDTYWVSMDSGAKDAIAELEEDGYTINYNWYAPDTKDNAKQIEQIDMAASNRSNVIMIAVNDPTACNAALKEVDEDGTNIIYVDAAATYPGMATFSTDNYLAGQQAGEEMIRILSEAGITEGQIGIVSAQNGVESCMNRIEGFCHALEGTGYEPSEVQYSEGDTSKAQEMGTNMINNGAVALFGVTGQASVGCGNAARDAKDKIYCVGFDSSSAVLSLVANGAIQSLIAQDPYQMGYQAMKAAVNAMDGEELDGKVHDIPVTVVTPENVEEFQEQYSY